MLRPLTALLLTAGLAVAATPAVATAASAAPQVLYGFAWADGTGTLRVTPAKATPVNQGGVIRHKFTPLSGAKERRIRYTAADFRRVTAECRLKETEGVVKLNAKGLGTTRCKPGDLTFVLGLGPAPVRISLGPATRIHEVLATPSRPKTAFGTIKHGKGKTIVFNRQGKAVKLGYTGLAFSRATRNCGDVWLSNHVNAGPDGLGTKDCTTASFTKVLGKVEYPVLAKVDYNPVTGQVYQVWEVFGDA